MIPGDLPQSELDLLAAYYAEASARLRQIILHPKGRTAGSADWKRAWAAQRIAQVDAILTALDRAALTWLAKSVSKSYRNGLAQALKQARDVGVRVPGSGVNPSFTLIDKDAVKILARDTFQDLQKASGSMAKTAATVLRHTAQHDLDESKINQILAGGIIEGTPRETIRALKQEFERVSKGGLVEVTDKNGDTRHFEPGYYAKMVAVTKTREAVTEGTKNRLQEVGIDLVTIGGNTTQNFCTAFLGLVFSISGDSKRYPPLSSIQGGPPFHPNCSKSLSPFVEAFADAEQLKETKADPDVSKLFNLDASAAQRTFKDLQLYQATVARIGPPPGGKRFDPNRDG